MHHPEISSIVKILDDYFLISSPDSSSTIKGRKLDWGNEDSIVICRELTNGRLEIQIKGENEDDNDLDVIYYQQGSNQLFDKRLQISCDNFHIETVRRAIRDVVIYDSNPDTATSNKNSVENWLKD
jgi:ribosomal protein L14E/L6E/L27E